MIKKTAIVLSAALFALLVLSTPASAQEENIEKVKASLKRGQYQSALNYADKIVNEYPDWVWSYMFMGRAHAGLDQHDKAIRQFQKGLDYAENDDQRFELKFRMAKAYFDSGEYKNALNQLNSAQRHKNSKIYRNARGAMLLMEGYSNFNLGNYSEAVASFKPIVDAGRATPDVLRAVAKSHQEMGNDAQAINVIKEVVKADPKDISAHKILVKSYVNNKDWNQAIVAADEAIKNFSRDAELYYLKGQSLFQLGRYNAAKAALKSSLEIDPAAKVRYLYAQAFLKTGDYFEATNQFNLAQRGFSNDADFYLNYAYAWIQWVPKDTENYKDTKEESSYKTALNNAEQLLNRSRDLGGDTKLINGYLEIVNQKQERLEQGKFYTEEYEIYIDPETGEIVKKKVGGGEN